MDHSSFNIWVKHNMARENNLLTNPNTPEAPFIDQSESIVREVMKVNKQSLKHGVVALVYVIILSLVVVNTFLINKNKETANVCKLLNSLPSKSNLLEQALSNEEDMNCTPYILQTNLSACVLMKPNGVSISLKLGDSMPKSYKLTLGQDTLLSALSSFKLGCLND